MSADYTALGLDPADYDSGYDLAKAMFLADDETAGEALALMCDKRWCPQMWQTHTELRAAAAATNPQNQDRESKATFEAFGRAAALWLQKSAADHADRRGDEYDDVVAQAKRELAESQRVDALIDAHLLGEAA